MRFHAIFMVSAALAAGMEWCAGTPRERIVLDDTWRFTNGTRTRSRIWACTAAGDLDGHCDQPVRRGRRILFYEYV